MNRQKSVDILQYNQQQAMRNMEKKKEEKIRQQQEDKQYIDRINNEIYQERHNQIIKKQSNIDQSQRSYMSYMTNKEMDNKENINQTQVFRHRNSKLKDLNTFKIGMENRELKRKNYQEYNDNLNTNPTRYDPRMLPGASNLNLYQVEKKTPKSSYNIINNEIKSPFNYIPDTKQQSLYMNKEKEIYDQYGRRNPIENEKFDRFEKLDEGRQAEEYHMSNNENYKDQNKEIPTNDNNYNQYNKIANDINTHQPNTNQEYGYDGHNDQSHYGHIDQTAYDKYKIEPTQTQNAPNLKKQSRKKVDLNSIYIPESIKTIEDYEKYLLGMGIDPLTLEYIEENHYQGKDNQYNQQENNDLSEKMENLKIGSNENYENYDKSNQYKDNNQYSNQYQYQDQLNHHYQQQQQQQPQQSQQQQYSKPSLNYKNQSQILIADASHYQKNKEEVRKEYEPFIKNKPVIVNPCK